MKLHLDMPVIGALIGLAAMAAGVALFSLAPARLPWSWMWGGLCLVWTGGVLTVLAPILWRIMP